MTLEKKVSSTPSSSEDRLPRSTYTFMMMDDAFGSLSWLFGFLVCLFQLSTIIIIAVDQINLSKDTSTFGIPWDLSAKGYVSQVVGAIFATLILGSSMLGPIYTILTHLPGSRWERAVSFNNKSSMWEWSEHILFPNILKVIVGGFILFVALVVILQNEHLLDMFKGFAALVLVDKLDFFCFLLASQGVVGPGARDMTKRIMVPKSSDVTFTDLEESKGKPAYSKQTAFISISFLFCLLFLTMFSGIFGIAMRRISGSLLEQKYPDCKFSFSFAANRMGDGICDGTPFNTIECGFEDGDCIDFNSAYPHCTSGGDLILSNVESRLGDGKCDTDLNIEQCDYDGGDCRPSSTALAGSP